MNRLFLVTLVALATLTGFGSVSQANPGDLIRSITNPQPENGDQFGNPVVALGDDILIGGYNDDSVYVFNGATTGSLQLTVNGPANQRFGLALATLGNHALVGHPSGQTAYLIDGVTGNILLTINNPAPSGNFGRTVAASNGQIIIGSYNARAAYVFDGALRGTTNAPTLTINAPGPDDGLFSGAICPMGDNILVGSPTTGRVYLFDGTLTGETETPLLTIEISNAGNSDVLAVTTMSDQIIVGAGGDHSLGQDMGAVYVFDGAARGIINTPLLTIANPNPDIYDGFGKSVATLGNDILIGGMQDDAVYLFDGTTGNLKLTITDPGPAGENYFGRSVATLGNNILVGAPGTDNQTGVVYLFAGLQPEPTPTPEPTVTPTMTPSTTPTPTDGRAVGDLNNDGCVGLTDFLILLDYWQTVSPMGGPVIGLDDFLTLLDYWQTGASC